MNDTPEQLRAYLIARNDILAKGDPDALMQFMLDWKLPVPSNRYAAEVTLHKARTGAVSLPRELRVASKRWLTERGYGSLDDGDLHE